MEFGTFVSSSALTKVAVNAIETGLSFSLLSMRAISGRGFAQFTLVSSSSEHMFFPQTFRAASVTLAMGFGASGDGVPSCTLLPKTVSPSARPPSASSACATVPEASPVRRFATASAAACFAASVAASIGARSSSVQ